MRQKQPMKRLPLQQLIRRSALQTACDRNPTTAPPPQRKSGTATAGMGPFYTPISSFGFIGDITLSLVSDAELARRASKGI